MLYPILTAFRFKLLVFHCLHTLFCFVSSSPQCGSWSGGNETAPARGTEPGVPGPGCGHPAEHRVSKGGSGEEVWPTGCAHQQRRSALQGNYLAALGSDSV